MFLNLDTIYWKDVLIISAALFVPALFIIEFIRRHISFDIIIKIKIFNRDKDDTEN